MNNENSNQTNELNFGHQTSDFGQKKPKELGYTFPAEWEEHEATWLSWPHKEESWPGKLEEISTSMYEKMVNINYLGSLYSSLAVIPIMKKQKSGRILFQL